VLQIPTPEPPRTDPAADRYAAEPPTASERSSWFKRIAYWRALWRGLRADRVSCTNCGSRFMRPSQREPGALTRFLGLRLFRCESCFERFVLPRAAKR
jgi:hypothetical protein